MSTQEIYDRLVPIFEDLFDIEDQPLTPETTADDVDGWDSLNHIRLILAIQKEFKIKFSATEIGELPNLGALVAVIASKI